MTVSDTHHNSRTSVSSNTVSRCSPDASVHRFNVPLRKGVRDDSSLAAFGFEGIAYERDGIEDFWFKVIVSNSAIADARLYP